MTINSKKYIIPELDFNTMCQLEDMGISLAEISKRPMATIRGFVALAVGDLETAGKEIEEHIINGGDFSEIMDEIGKAVNESGFFQTLSKTKTEIHTENQKKSQNKA